MFPMTVAPKSGLPQSRAGFGEVRAPRQSRHSASRLRLVAVVGLSVLAVQPLISLEPDARAQSDEDAAESSNRIVHRFDFAERDDGNLEDVPRYWEPLVLDGFPHYATGKFDDAIGRPGAPSFHLQCEGRNVAYRYSGPNTPVNASTDYRIQAYIRPDRLRYARACLSAHFVDRLGLPIDGSLVRSRYIGGENASDEWQRIELHLAAAPDEAASIGLTAWVVQGATWNDAPPHRRQIAHRDLFAGAWFDDITVFALPRAQLSTGVEGNVITPNDEPMLRISLAANERPAPTGTLSIMAADGVMVERHSVMTTPNGSADPPSVSLAHLGPGIYHARLDVYAGKTLLVTRTLTFAKVEDIDNASGSLGRSFGVVIDPRARTDTDTELALLDAQAVGSVKLPVWTGLPDAPPTIQQRRSTDRMLQELVKRGFDLSAVFVGPPGGIVRGSGAYVRPLIDLLAGNPNAWNEHLASVVAPHATAFRWWQIGPDAAPPVADPVELDKAIAQLGQAMRAFITIPRLAVPVRAASNDNAGKPSVDHLVLTMGREIDPDSFATLIKQAKSDGYVRVSVYIEPAPEDRYRRLPRLADWTQRMVLARHGGADTVFAPQTWRVRDGVFGRTAEPTEDFIAMRTIASSLGNLRPGPRVALGEGVVCLAFSDDTNTTLVIWDRYAPPSGKQYAIQLGQARRQVDLWGNTTPLGRDEHGRQVVRVTNTPVFVSGVDRWLIDFRTAMTLTPRRVDTGSEIVSHAIEIAYHGDHSINGELSLLAPSTWALSRRHRSFSAQARRISHLPLEIRYPHNEPAGTKSIVAQISLESPPYYLEVPLEVSLELTDVAVWGTAVVERSDLVLHHVVTNHTKNVLSFRGAAVVPGQQRQYRPMSGLLPGDSQTVRYRFPNGASLIGRTVRLMLREVNDGPRSHNLELVVP